MEKRIKHGMSRTSLYKALYSMKGRCFNKQNPEYSNYGGRGISVCEEWKLNFIAFSDYISATLGPRPSSRHSLDRINNDGNYEPGNLRWATPSEQNSNRRHANLAEIERLRIENEELRQILAGIASEIRDAARQFAELKLHIVEPITFPPEEKKDVLPN
jgi:hypothetical protein